MGTKGKRILLAAGLLGSILAGAAPAMADSHGGGGHASGGGGGGHASAGGGHPSGGGHVGGGGGAAPSGGGHFAAGAGYSAHYSPAYHGGAYATHGGYGYGRPGAYSGHGYYGRGYYGYGYSTGAYWRGGYWHGGFWPRCYYGLGFSWFLPVLPLAYATYWYGSIPYYYANDVYYTYDPSYEGYVATDPPPVAEGGGAGVEGGPPSAGPPSAGPPSDGAVQGQVFMYPKNGQSTEQQAADKAECQQWAAQQAGAAAQNGSDYQRAMSACVEGRGYSAR